MRMRMRKRKRKRKSKVLKVWRFGVLRKEALSLDRTRLNGLRKLRHGGGYNIDSTYYSNHIDILSFHLILLVKYVV